MATLPAQSNSAVPSGVAATDTAAIQTALNALSAAAGASNVATALFNSATPFKINAPFYKPWNVNIEGNAVFQAVEGFPAESVLLQDSPPTTVAAESNGGDITSIASWAKPSAGVLKVASTTGYPSQGQIRVVDESGTAIINYTGTTSTSFTGCTLGGGTGGVVSTGGKIAARTYKGTIGTGITLDSNNIAQTGLSLHFFAGIDLGCVVQNSLGDDVILGDTAAVSSSSEPKLLATFGVDRTGGSLPSGHRCLWVRSANDGKAAKNIFKGQETGVQCDSGDWTFETPHAWTNGMKVCFQDNGLNNKWLSPIADTPTEFGILLGSSQAQGTYVSPLIQINSLYGLDNVVVAVRNNGSGQKNTFVGPILRGANAEHRIASDYTGDRTGLQWIGASWENVVSVNLATTRLTGGQTTTGGQALVLSGDTTGSNQIMQVLLSPSLGGTKVFALDAAGRLARSHAQATLTGTTAGTAVSSQPDVGSSYKKFLVFLSGYKNASVTAQTITFPVAFSKTPYLAKDDSGGASVSTTTLTLPKEMASEKTGWITVEGY